LVFDERRLFYFIIKRASGIFDLKNRRAARGGRDTPPRIPTPAD
jgi:hypothetical protein